MSSQLDNELGAVVAKIEDIVESLIEALAVEAVMEIPLRRRESGHRSLVKFPASSEKEVKKFSTSTSGHVFIVPPHVSRLAHVFNFLVI